AVDVGLQVLVEVRGADIALAAEVLLVGQVERVGQPRVQFRVAAAAGEDPALRVEAVGGVGAQVVHARSGHLPRGAEAQYLVGRQFEGQVQARQYLGGAAAAGGGRLQRHALEGRHAGGVLLRVDDLYPDVAAHRHAAQHRVQVGLHVEGRDLLVDTPVLVVDVAVVLVPQVEHAALEHAPGIQGDHAGQPEVAEAVAQDVLLRDRHLHVVDAGGGGAQRRLGGGAALGAVGQVGAEVQRAEHALLEAADQVQAERGELVRDFE